MSGPQLPLRCPPILWFGNGASSKHKLLTVGANPSRSEFLVDSAEVAIGKVRSSGDQSRLRYLEPPRNRFRLLHPGEEMADILISDSLQGEIIASYNSYFANQPYKEWFGHNRDDSYKVEGFLRGFGASYYGDNPSRVEAVHIDLFPFATLDDFGQIKGIVYEKLFADGWAQRIVDRLIAALAPMALILFGRTNCEYFAEYLDPSLPIDWTSFSPAHYFIGRSERFGLPVVGLSTNLGNPKGFNALTLKQFGEHVRRALQEKTGPRTP